MSVGQVSCGQVSEALQEGGASSDVGQSLPQLHLLLPKRAQLLLRPVGPVRRRQRTSRTRQTACHEANRMPREHCRMLVYSSVSLCSHSLVWGYVSASSTDARCYFQHSFICLCPNKEEQNGRSQAVWVIARVIYLIKGETTSVLL